MHLHAYSKANYQTNIQIPYAILHKLQIISGTSVKIRIEKWGVLVKNEEKEKKKNILIHFQEDCSNVALSTQPNLSVHSVTGLGPKTKTGENKKKKQPFRML